MSAARVVRTRDPRVTAVAVGVDLYEVGDDRREKVECVLFELLKSSEVSIE